MGRVIQRRTTVKEGGHVEVQSDELPEGATVEVTVMLEDEDTPDGKRKLVDMIGTGTGLFKTPEEVDAYIRELRD